MKKPIISVVFAAAAAISFSADLSAQTRKRRPEAKKPPAAVKEATASVEAEKVPPKRNERPNGDAGSSQSVEKRAERPIAQQAAAFEYEFTNPNFAIETLKIEHDEAGAGKISFRRKDNDEMITDPIQVSPKALARINGAFAALNFLDSNESYQHAKDFSHMGTVKVTRRAGGRSRTTTYNWTDNKEARLLADEYRKIGNQYVWMFDIALSRDNQPLEAPRLMDSLDAMIRRNEISDAHQMEPFLRELSNDERVPLIARNHAAKLVKQFEKERSREKK